MDDTTAQQDMDLSREKHLIPGREIHMKDLRTYHFCEVGLITGTTQENAVANIWNTTGVFDPTPEQFAALDPEVLAKETGAIKVWLNPVRHWMFDEFDVWEVGDDREFNGIKATWMAVVGAADMMKATVQGSYFSGYIYRNTAFRFNEGSEVYLLDAPNGEVFVIQAFTTHWDKSLTKDNSPSSAVDSPCRMAGRSGPRSRTATCRSRRPRPDAWRTLCRTTCITLIRAPTAARPSTTSPRPDHSQR